MTVDISSLRTLVNNRVANVNVSTESSANLTLLLKTSQNAGGNTTPLVNELTTRVLNIANTASVANVATLASATSLITTDRTLAVANLAVLNALTNISAGTIYHVDSENLPYIRKTDGTWVVIDPSLHAQVITTNVWGWGENGSGQLGDGTIVAKSSPVSILGNISDWKQVSSGVHTMALRANGTAWAWGSNARGRLGDGTTTARSSPVSVLGGFTDWVQVAAGLYHSAGIRSNGTAWTWGDNGYGELGIGVGGSTLDRRSSPVSVIGGFTDWVMISPNGQFTVALRANGTLWSWGRNISGQLGNGTTTNRSSPGSVVGGFTDWVQVAAGIAHALAIRANGTAWGWGYNSNINGGALGDDTFVNKSSPVSVVGGFTDWVQVAAGAYHSAGVRANGSLWCWGSNSFGRLGDSTTTLRTSPVSVVGGFTDWVQASAGRYHTMGLRANGTLWGWGIGFGAIGDNTNVSRSSPVSVVGGFTDWVQVSSGRAASIALRGSN